MKEHARSTLILCLGLCGDEFPFWSVSGYEAGWIGFCEFICREVEPRFVHDGVLRLGEDAGGVEGVDIAECPSGVGGVVDKSNQQCPVVIAMSERVRFADDWNEEFGAEDWC